jgi:chemotaxis protein methyltransferase CheR
MATAHAPREDPILAQFCRLIGTHTGLVIPEHDLPYLQERLVRRQMTTHSGTADRYLELLADEGAAGAAEWRALVLELTTGESYFFRDAGQMRLLREVVLPELLRLRAGERTLRIWSAGCSTGEEPYSLAIILRDLLPGAGNWKISILGTDINEEALQRARLGRYGRWAFRGVPEEMVERHFSRNHGEWQLHPELREMVRFERLNLIRDRIPDPARDLCNLDLIVCRNVFIYFNHDAIAGIMAQFAATLRPGGYILTGHAEVQQPVSQLVSSGVLPLLARQFPDSVIFQRPLSGDPQPLPKLFVAAQAKREFEALTRSKANQKSFSPSSQPPTPRRPPLPPVTPPVEKRLREMRALFDQGRYGDAIRLGESLLDENQSCGDLCLLLARCHANLGEEGKAEKYCRDALRHRPFAAEPHFLLANLLHDRGDTEQAKDLLNRTLYLDHAHVPAYLHLATLYQELGIMDRAKQMRLGALDVLHSLPAESRIEHYEEWTVKELVFQLEQIIGQSAGR